MNDKAQVEPTGRATYCPEDNKLRLYIGRVPRDEFLTLRAEGWTTLHKQREAGGGDFVATWTPERRDTALRYAGVIEDEDMGPEDRAADRAERFSLYRDKRAAEACGHADKYDNGPAVHGFQDYARAVRSADRHDKQATCAVDAWDTAEYWTRRTAGVIAHALHVSSPSVRMGRIKTLEAEARRIQQNRTEYAGKWNLWRSVAQIADPSEQTEKALQLAALGVDWCKYTHPRTGAEVSLYDALRVDASDRITGAEACALYFDKHTDPESDAWHDTRPAQWARHYALRIAYENQMLEAQGGRLASVEIVAGGLLHKLLIVKINKSNATGRVVSVQVRGPRVEGYCYRARNVPGTDYALHQFDTERMKPDAYTPPTPETLAQLAAFKSEAKAKAPKAPACPIINPTPEAAAALMEIWNQQAKAKHIEAYTRRYGRDYADDFKPARVVTMTQERYSALSAGTYSAAETRGVRAHGFRARRSSNMWSESGAKYDKETGRDLCKVRILTAHAGRDVSDYTPPAIIVLIDKPQKPLPVDVLAPAEAPFALVSQ